MRRSSRLGLRGMGAMVAVAALLATGACGDDGGKGSDPPKDTAKAPSASPSPAVPLTLAVAAPAANAAKVPTSTDVTVNTSGEVRDVKLADAKGGVVPGALLADKKTWRPNKQLSYETKYTATVTAASGAESKTATTTFTTMAKRGSITGADIYLNDGEQVGVGMPVVVELTRSVPVGARAAIERRLMVNATPAAEGSWHWFSNSEVHYRPKDHWAPGTKVAVRIAIGGLPMGNGSYGKRDRFATFTVGRARITKIINATKTMTVYENGTPVRSIPISLGKPSTPTSSGTMVAMDKAAEMTFDSGTFGVPSDSAGGYRQKVYWDVRFTWGGEFVHAAPWSVRDQGRRNVSHGCANASPANAKWFYDTTLRGDVIEIVGTERKVTKGDGWTDWSMTWEQYQAGSALS